MEKMSGLISWLGFWERTHKPPLWIRRASEKFYYKYTQKFLVQPYDRVKYFKGRNYFYKVVYSTIAQGKIEERFYIKKKWV